MNRKYLDEVQYKDSSKLARRAVLHVKYGSGDWFGFVAAHAGLAAGMTILDIGCGAGWFWEKTADRHPADLDLTLADSSPGMVGEARARVAGLGRFARVAGRVADVCDLPFPDAHFDRVLAMHMLYHAGDKPKALAEIARVLKPGGVALITTNGDRSMAEADSIRAETFGLPGGPAIDFTLESAPPLLNAAFADVDLEVSKSGMRCTDPGDVFDYLTSFPPGDAASDDDLTTLRRLIAERFEAGRGVLAITVESGVFLCRN